MVVLATHSATRFVHVRTVPRSRHNPQFGRDTLQTVQFAQGLAISMAQGIELFDDRHGIAAPAQNVPQRVKGRAT